MKYFSSKTSSILSCIKRIFIFGIIFFFFNNTPTIYAAVYNGDYTGPISSNNNTVTGNFNGALAGENNTIYGDVTGSVSGFGDVVCNNLYGDLSGENNVIWGKVSGLISGVGNVVKNTNGGIGPCSTTNPPTPFPVPGNIIDLNFAINNSFPWIQAICGDVRMDNGVTNKAPLNQSMLTTNGSCASPGIVFPGNGTTEFGQGQPSSTSQVAGGTSYPEVYTPSSSGGIFSSYTYLSQKSQSGGITTINLSTVCNVSDCTLPANLPNGIYITNEDVTLNDYTFPLNHKYIFLINGNLTINGNIITPNSSSTFFSASGNIIIPASVGSPANVTTANLAGIFSTDKAFIMQTNNNCTDLRLNVEGTLIVNAGRTGSSLQNNRDLCGNNGTYPTMVITQRLDYILNLPEFMRVQNITSQEINP